MASPNSPRNSASLVRRARNQSRSGASARGGLILLRPAGQASLAAHARMFTENRRWVEAGCRLRPDLPDLEGVQRLLFRHFGHLLCHWPQAAAGDATALHQVRIALRRVGTVLRAFRKRLKPTTARALRRDVRKLNRALGPARDLDDWLDFLQEPGVAAGDADGYLAAVRRRRRTAQRTVQRLLGESHFRAIHSRFDSLLRVELPQLRAHPAPVPLAQAAGEVLARHWQRARKLGRHRHSRDDGKLHELRIALRRLRYLAEDFAPILGEQVERLRQRTHALERVVAQLRESLRDLARFSAENPPPPRYLRSRLRQRRKHARATLENTWAEFEDRDFRRTVKARLKDRT